MNPTRARRRIRELVRQRRYRISGYCALRMLERCVSEGDVLAVLKSASGDAVVVVNTFRGDEDEDEQG